MLLSQNDGGDEWMCLDEKDASCSPGGACCRYRSLTDNELTTLPDGLFSDLSSLRVL